MSDITTEYLCILCAPKGLVDKNGKTSPVYATICKKPHWDFEGVMLTSGTHDATKIEPTCPDLEPLLNYCNNHFNDREFIIIKVPINEFGKSLKHELWSNEKIKDDFSETHKIKDCVVY